MSLSKLRTGIAGYQSAQASTDKDFKNRKTGGFDLIDFFMA
jgi:hypothetical protein